MLRGDGDEPLHVRRSVERRRHNTFGGWLADLPHEPLEQKRLEANKGFPSLGRLRDERMGHPLGAKRERTGRQRKPSIADIEGELAIEDVEPLVFIGVDVIVSSMPRTQKASPSSSPSLYPSFARCVSTSDITPSLLLPSQPVAWVANPDLEGGQVAVLRLHVVSAHHVTPPSCSKSRSGASSKWSIFATSPWLTSENSVNAKFSIAPRSRRPRRAGEEARREGGPVKGKRGKEESRPNAVTLITL